ncbi:hypothetical protein FHS55_002128 [Angulomicrobium tetraedrale]|uniref:DUF2635 domain-containing protein n=1 Tax=Ancylobacter tetraedralis TaxID=217068 RepID=A0A839Z9X1_9HYPH|nr:hypothetical protein [Ancylobacter tetraedralis]MBB3771529.1 hypothetical protein [Ancylobacter tetraedralis]
MTRYRARPGLRIPMPGRPGQFVPEGGDGIVIDEQNGFFLRLVADGDLVEAPASTPTGKTEGKK